VTLPHPLPPPLELDEDDEDDDEVDPPPHVSPQTEATSDTHWLSHFVSQQYESAPHIAVAQASHEDVSLAPLEQTSWAHASAPPPVVALLELLDAALELLDAALELLDAALELLEPLPPWAAICISIQL
jgi:hypothetical protein